MAVPYYNKHGMLTTNRNGLTGDNDIKVTIEYDFRNPIARKNIPFYIDIHLDLKKTGNGKLCFLQYPESFHDDASHDNLTAIATWSFLNGHTYHKRMKILGRVWHPRDWGYYLWLRGGAWRLLSYFFFWFTCLSMISTCNDDHKTRPHGKFVDTDGKLLAHTRFQLRDYSTMLRITERICESILASKESLFDWQKREWVEINSFDDAFIHYYPEDHPLHQLILNNRSKF